MAKYKRTSESDKAVLAEILDSLKETHDRLAEHGHARDAETILELQDAMDRLRGVIGMAGSDNAQVEGDEA